jgi:tetratricopeptide (TPR) repeat protein
VPPAPSTGSGSGAGGWAAVALNNNNNNNQTVMTQQPTQTSYNNNPAQRQMTLITNAILKYPGNNPGDTESDPTSLSDDINSSMTSNNNNPEWLVSAESQRALNAGLGIVNPILENIPAFFPGYILAARVLCRMQRVDDAVRLVSTGLSRGPQHSGLLLTLAQCHLYQGGAVGSGSSGSSGSSTSTANTTSSTANQALRICEQALASDFSIRAHPRYHYLRGAALLQQSQYQEAMKAFDLVLGPGAGTGSTSGTGSTGSGIVSAINGPMHWESGPGPESLFYHEVLTLSLGDKVGTTILYALALSRERRVKEAQHLLSQCRLLLSSSAGSSTSSVVYSEVLIENMTIEVLIASAIIYEEHQDYDHAIRMLDRIGNLGNNSGPGSDPTSTSSSSSSAAIARAILHKAEIVLKHFHDKEQFIKCFEQLANYNNNNNNNQPGDKSGPGSHPTMSHVATRVAALSLLAEAYLRILNPERAILILEDAYQLINDAASSLIVSSAYTANNHTNNNHTNNNNHHQSTDLLLMKRKLRRKLGGTLIVTHEYHRAIEFYESALRPLLQQLTSGGVGSESGLTREDLGFVLELAGLYTRLSRFESAIRLLNDFLDAVTRLLPDLGSGPGSSSMSGGPNNTNSSNNNNNNNRVSMIHSYLNIAEQRVSLLEALSVIYSKTLPSPNLSGQQQSLVDAITTQKQIVLYWKHLLSTTATTTSTSTTTSVSSGTTSSLLGSASSVNSGGNKSYHQLQLERAQHRLSRFCVYLGDHYVLEHEFSEAEKCFEESLALTPVYLPPIYGLACIYLKRNDWTRAMSFATRVLHVNPSHREAALLYSEAILRADNDKPEAAATPLQQYLTRHPTDYLVLEKTLSLLRRAGQLLTAKTLLETAATIDKKHRLSPGYRYCSGLYARYVNDIGKAIVEFNVARRDPGFGARALCAMIELYLNPDQESIWQETESSSNNNNNNNEDNASGGPNASNNNNSFLAGSVDEETRLRIAAAESLLQELKPLVGEDDSRVRVLEGYCLLSTRSKINLDKAMNIFNELLEQNNEYLPAILGVATAYMIERNQVIIIIIIIIILVIIIFYIIIIICYTMLYSTMLNSIILYYYYYMLYYVILYYVKLYYIIIICYTMLYSTMLNYIILYYY